MSRNSKGKRDAKAKVRSKQQRAGQAQLGDFHAGGFSGPLNGDLAPAGGVPGRLFRSSCDECGSKDLAWMTTRELADRVPADERARVQEGVDFLGPGAQAWLCGSCGNFGIMTI
jgi:hypothetical protein